MAITVKRLENCRACGGTGLELKLTLGNLYPSTFLTKEEKVKFENGEFKKAPLTLVECLDCGLVQLQDTVELDDMYRKYWYKSSLNKSMVRDLKDVCEKTLSKWTEKSVPVSHIDIGCNDGTLSKFFHDEGLITLGFDPAENLKEDAEKNCDYFVNDYFNSTNVKINGKADIITAIAMFYDLPDISKFLTDVCTALTTNGIFVVQLTDLYSMLKINAFDNICHEHLEYYTLNWLVHFFKKHELTIFDAEYNKVNGGSLRIYACKTGQRTISPRVIFYQLRESLYFKLNKNWDDKLIRKIIEIGTKIKLELLDAKRPIALGASTKGNTLLQVLNIGRFFLIGIGEVNEDKFDLYTIGTLIPILPEERMMNVDPDICLILPFHFESTFLKNFDKYMDDGGKLLFPIPAPRIAYKENGKLKWKYL